MSVTISEGTTDTQAGEINQTDYANMQIEFQKYVPFPGPDAKPPVIKSFACFFKIGELQELINTYNLMVGTNDNTGLKGNKKKYSDGMTFCFAVMPDNITSCEQENYSNRFCITVIATTVNDNGEHAFYNGLGDIVLIPGFKRLSGGGGGCCGSINPPGFL